MSVRLWYQVICASPSCTIASSDQAWANARMYLRFLGENPSMPGNSQQVGWHSRRISSRLAG